MKKIKNKQGKRVSREMKAQNALLKAQKNTSDNLQTITVKNAEGDPDTVAQIVVQNQINYTPKVSVIIPVYNVEQYLRECLDSVINQTLKEIEIICVDDGSTDKSLDILLEYAAKDNRITVLKQENLHAGVARNAGLAVARGEYLSFLDSDDFFELNMLEEMSKRADEDKSDVVVCGNYVYDEQKQKMIRQVHIGKHFLEATPFSPTLFGDKLFTFCNPNPWTKLFKHDIFIRNNLRYESYIRCNDLTCVCSALASARKISVIDTPFIIYRSNQKSNVTSQRSEQVDCFLYAVDKLEKKLKKLNLYQTFKQDFIDRVTNSFRWELSVCTDEQKQKIKEQAEKILSKDTYSILYSPQISIIIPVYNVEKYLRECLDSVINQTLKDIEIICVNDGSPDNSLAILKEYAAKDKRIIIIDQKNQGLSCSRNNALKVAKGEYIVFLDSDDFIQNNALEIIFNNMTIKQLDMLSYSGINFDNDTKNEMTNPYWEFLYLPKDFCYEKFNHELAKNFITKMAVSSCLTAYKRSMLLKCQITFPEHLCFEDNLFFTKSLLNAEFCGIIKDKLYCRRIHNEAITQNWDKHFTDYLQVTDMVLQYVKIKNKQLFTVYQNSYLGRCINIYNQFEIDYRKKYAKKLKYLLKKYNYIQKNNINYPTSIITYLLLPYYKLKLPALRAKYFAAQSKAVKNSLQSFRIDIKNLGSAENTVEINAPDTQISTPAWFTNTQGIGQVVSGSSTKQKLTIKAIKSGTLQFNFRGQDKRNPDGARFPLWVDYKSIKIDDREILSMPIATWHDKPYRYEMPVKDGQQITVEFEQQPHPYTIDELKDTILKLNPNSTYIKQNINKIAEQISGSASTLPEEKNSRFASLKHFLYHKTETETCTKTYICGVRVRKKPVNIYSFIDKRLAEFSKTLDAKFSKLSEQLSAGTAAATTAQKELLAKVNDINKNTQTELSSMQKTIDKRLNDLEKETQLLKSNGLYTIKVLNKKLDSLFGMQNTTADFLSAVQKENRDDLLAATEELRENLLNNSAENRQAILGQVEKVLNMTAEHGKTLQTAQQNLQSTAESAQQAIIKQIETAQSTQQTILGQAEHLKAAVGSQIIGFETLQNSQNETIKSLLAAETAKTEQQFAEQSKNYDILSKKIDSTTSSVITAVERDQILYTNPFEVRTREERGLCDIVNAPDFTNRFRKLITNLPQESIATIVSIIKRLQLIKGTNNKLDLYNAEEKELMKSLKSYFQSILKISDNLYCCQNYFLPINHFEPSVFFYKHGLDKLKNPQYFKNKVILDVGAFIGDSALILSPLTTDKVYSFEATTENYNNMLKTIELNNLTNVVAVKTAVGSENTNIDIRYEGSASSSSELMIKEPKYIEKCPVIRIDDYVKEHNLNVGLIKVDIEGAEQDFLKGAMQTIKEYKPTMLISIYHNIDDFLDIKPMIESWNLGYKFTIFKPVIGSISGETLLICEQ